LYASTSSGSAIRLGTVGTGLPTAAGPTITNLPGLPTSTGSPYSFFFADLSGSVAGIDTLYLADDGGTIQKYSLVNGTWVSKGTLTATSIRGLTGVVNGTSVTLYGTNGSQVVGVTDNSGYNATISGTVTTLRTAVTNTALRGIALAPVSAATPADLTVITISALVCCTLAALVPAFLAAFLQPAKALRSQ
jgi:ABC-type antimicrobial peptide transport system permease subunit